MITAQALPYERNLFKQVLSEETIYFHYDKHHLGYVKKLNSLISLTESANLTLEEIIKKSYQERNKPIFNNSAQIWNHDFYWQSLALKSEKPSAISSLIDQYFTGFDIFNEKIIENGMLLFGSGWIWLVQDKKTKALSLIATYNAENPITLDLNPILTIDVWEHAYYIDYKNDRKAYLTNIVKYLNWNFANKNLIN